LLQTVFRFLDYGDSLHFEPRNDGDIVLATPLTGVPDHAHLAVRAARALQLAAGCKQGATIQLTKRLPLGGGLGGGSSDAATTLIALNHLWRTGVSTEALQQIGLTLGADVPVFIHGQTAFAEGVGEKFTPVSPAPAWYLVAVPPISVPTVEIFRSSFLKRNTEPIDPATWRDGFGANDMQAVACALYPAVASCLQALRSYGDARMSGSGACCFVAFGEQDQAVAALEKFRLEAPDTTGFVACGLDVHPLFALDNVR
jgi:4-diphosphocytidyl-2-C-methyl-D-erythritol kinase